MYDRLKVIYQNYSRIITCTQTDHVDIFSNGLDLQPLSQGLENVIVYIFCPFPQLHNVNNVQFAMSTKKRKVAYHHFLTLEGGMGVLALIL